jgi:hypothetical protein
MSSYLSLLSLFWPCLSVEYFGYLTLLYHLLLLNERKLFEDLALRRINTAITILHHLEIINISS